MNREQAQRTRIAVILVVGMVIFVSVAVLWGPTERAYACYSDWAAGERVQAEIVKVDPAIGIVLALPDGTACTAPPGPHAFESFEIGGSVEAIQRLDRPGDCELAATVDEAENLLLFLVLSMAAVLGGLVLAAFFIARSATSVPALTSRFDLSTHELPCPRCRAPMREGYLPLVGAIHWRELTEAVGFPTAYGGLPGTFSLRRSPRLHAFRCPTCEIVTFTHGKPNDPT